MRISATVFARTASLVTGSRMALAAWSSTLFRARERGRRSSQAQRQCEKAGKQNPHAPLVRRSVQESQANLGDREQEGIAVLAGRQPFGRQDLRDRHADQALGIFPRVGEQTNRSALLSELQILRFLGRNETDQIFCPISGLVHFKTVIRSLRKYGNFIKAWRTSVTIHAGR